MVHVHQVIAYPMVLRLRIFGVTEGQCNGISEDKVVLSGCEKRGRNHGPLRKEVERDSEAEIDNRRYSIQFPRGTTGLRRQ